MSDKRQKNQLVLAFTEMSRSEAPRDSGEGTEALMVKRKAESMVGSEQLMEEVCERKNCEQALARVKSNKGSAGIDGMTVEELPAYLKKLANHSGTAVKWHLQTAGGEAGRNTQASWWGAAIGYPNSAGSLHPASRNASTATQVGPNLLSPQLRVPTRALGTSGSNQSTAIYRGGIRLGGGLGLREIL